MQAGGGNGMSGGRKDGISDRVGFPDKFGVISQNEPFKI